MSCGVLASAAPFAYGQTHKDIKAIEIAQLPAFCYSQYVEGATAPEFKIPPGCGPGMNHYCFALVELNRGKRAVGNRNQRLTHLKLSRAQTLYTLRAMEQYPHCPIRAHVDKTFNEVNAILMGLGQK
jgi:hypothetical protein